MMRRSNTLRKSATNLDHIPLQINCGDLFIHQICNRSHQARISKDLKVDEAVDLDAIEDEHEQGGGSIGS